MDIGITPFTNGGQLTYLGLYGPDYNKLQLYINDAEVNEGKIESADIDIFYWHLLNQFWAVKGGLNYLYQPAEKPYWQPGIGIEGLLPYFIEIDLRSYYTRGSTKFDFEISRDTQITKNFFLRTEVRSILATKTVPRAQLGSGLNEMQYTVRPFYRLKPGVDLFVEFEHAENYGRFKQFQKAEGESPSQNTVTLGLSLIL